MKLSSEKKEILIKTIEVRLEEIGEATKRARITFIIAIITSCAMLITLWNTYFSYTQKRSFDKSFKFKANKINEESELEFFKKLENKDNVFVQHLNSFINTYKSKDKEIKSTEDLVKDYETLKQIKEMQTDDIEESKVLKKQKDIYEKSLKNFLNTINEKILAEEDFYNGINNPSFYSLIYGESPDIDGNIKTQRAAELKNIIKDKILDKETLDVYSGVNHLNKFILEKIFPELHWESTFHSEKQNPIPLYEYNRRAAVAEWIENQDINIGLLGIRVNVDQFSLLGGFALMIISFWMLFSFRRENRSIVSLLRDVKNEVHSPSKIPKEDETWDIANLAFHGIVHKLLFANTGRSDKPMSKQDIFGEKTTGFDTILNNYTAGLTKLIRGLSLALLFLPVLTVILIIITDISTTSNKLSPFSSNPTVTLILRNIEPLNGQIIREVLISSILGLITLLGCIACLIFQIRTTQALLEFEKNLHQNKLDERKDSSIEKKAENNKE